MLPKSTPAALLFVTMQLTLAGCEKCPSPAVESTPPIPGVGTDYLVTSLANTRLEADQVRWEFTAQRFIVDNPKGPDAPLDPDIVESVLGRVSSARHIEGSWRIDAKATLLILSNIESDGKKVEKEARLPVASAGLLAINLGTRQYSRQNVVTSPADRHSTARPTRSGDTSADPR
jgi:hypothetical protein